MDETKAATKIQAGFRGLMGRKKADKLREEIMVDSKILATLECAMAWKICGKEHQLIGEGVITVVRSSLKGENVCFLDFSPSISECTEGGDSADSDEQEQLRAEVFPCPLSPDVPVTKHSGVFFVFPTVAFSEGIFVGVKVSHKEANYEKFIAALEITSEVQDSANLKKAKERGELVQRYAQKGAEVISTAGHMVSAGLGRLGAFAKSKIKKKETDTKISESTMRKITAAQVGADKAVQVSGVALDMMQIMCKSMSVAIVESVESTDSYKKYKTRTKKKSPPSGGVVQAKIIASQAIIGYAMLVDAMFAAGEEVLDTTIDTTADLVEHRHGSEAGKAAKGAAGAAKDSVHAGMTMAKIGPRGMIKTTAKDAGAHLAKDAV